MISQLFIRRLYALAPAFQPDPEKPEGVRLTQADFPEADPEWSPDERTIYFTSIDPKSRHRGIFKIDIKTKSKNLVIENAVNPSISPDGKYLAFVSSEGKRHLWVQNLMIPYWRRY